MHAHTHMYTHPPARALRTPLILMKTKIKLRAIYNNDSGIEKDACTKRRFDYVFIKLIKLYTIATRNLYQQLKLERNNTEEYLQVDKMFSRISA